MKILKANVNDLTEILSLQKLSYQENAVRYNDYDIPPLKQSLDDLEAAYKENHIFLKAVDDDVIIGSVRGYLKDNYAFIEKIIVHPEHQNQGIGRKLMLAIEQEFDVSVFRLFTGHLDEKNISLYTKLGYVIYGEQTQISPTLSFIKMEKKIDATAPPN